MDKSLIVELFDLFEVMEETSGLLAGEGLCAWMKHRDHSPWRNFFIDQLGDGELGGAA
jgi:hypothetical protein